MLPPLSGGTETATRTTAATQRVVVRVLLLVKLIGII